MIRILIYRYTSRDQIDLRIRFFKEIISYFIFSAKIFAKFSYKGVFNLTFYIFVANYMTFNVKLESDSFNRLARCCYRLLGNENRVTSENHFAESA